MSQWAVENDADGPILCPVIATEAKSDSNSGLKSAGIRRCKSHKSPTIHSPALALQSQSALAKALESCTIAYIKTQFDRIIPQTINNLPNKPPREDWQVTGSLV